MSPIDIFSPIDLRSGNCAGLANNSFDPFFTKGAGVAAAKRICNGGGNGAVCPVRAECLAMANAAEAGHGRRYGVFGGMSAQEREQKFGVAAEPAEMCRAELHVMDDDNVHVLPGGHRRCKACQNLNALKNKRAKGLVSDDPYGGRGYVDTWAGLSEVEYQERVEKSSHNRVRPLEGYTPAAHGTYSMYSKGCRCDPCKAAHSSAKKSFKERWQAWPEAIPEHVHGTMNGYSNYGCRCDRCKEYMAGYSHDMYVANKSQLELINAS